MVQLSTERDLTNWLEQAFSREHTHVYDDMKVGPVRDVLAFMELADVHPVTIAGTKGKGSTLAFLESILVAHEVVTIAFTSPHVFSITERWRIDGHPVRIPVACAAAEKVDQAERESGAELTYFERCFVMAVVMAADRPDGIFICEVGLGGRLDCANALDTRLALLTHISHDHCELLGDTLEEIAGEKLAVARPNRPLLIAPQSDEARKGIAARLPMGQKHQWLQRDPGAAPWALGLSGAHQQDNAVTAWSAAQCLVPDFDAERAMRALQQTFLPARCQMLHQDKRSIIVDGAHNGPSVQATLAVAQQKLRPNWQLIIGTATDKRIDDILAAVSACGVQTVIRCGYDSTRARTQEQWPVLAQQWPYRSTIIDALALVSDDVDVCITGSFYLAGEALASLHDPSVDGE